jgi:hypothetical protein
MSRSVAGRAGRRLAFWVAATALVSGCGGAQRADEPARRPARAEVLPEDQAFSAKQIEIQGNAFVPEALGFPAMPEVAIARSASLERQRKLVASRARPSAGDVKLLVGLLWQEADRAAEADAARAGALREEARVALRAARARSAGKTDRDTLHMLAVAETWLGDDGAASAAFEELLTRTPPEEQAGLRVWQAYVMLRQHRLADVGKLTADWKPDQLSDLGAYVLAWVAFVTGDAEGARKAITTAAATWKDAVSRPAVERDLVLILARTGTEVADAARLVAEAAGADAERRYVWMFKLSEAYKFAGDYQAAATVLDLIVDAMAKSDKGAMPPDDLVGFRYRQADYAFRLNRPSEAAQRAMQAQKELTACAAKCPADTVQAVTDRILKLAQFSHTVYAKSLDGAHYDAAVALYQHYVAIPGRPDASEARGYLSSLQETRATAQPGSGKHDQDVLLNFFWARREAVASCYERALLAQPGLDGSLELKLEIDARGAVTGATTEPGAGAEGMPAVAGCVIERARTWTFPTRTVPGKTTLSAPIQFSVQAPSADGAVEEKAPE